MNLLTHLIIGAAISECLLLNPLITIISAVIPDIDYLIGLTHRTITHSLLFLITSVIITWRLTNKRKAMAVFLGLSSHLMLDSVTTQGVMLLFPLRVFYSFNLFKSNNNSANISVIITSLIFIINKENIHEFLFSLRKGVLLKWTLILVSSWFIILSLKPISRPVSFKGVICSNITVKHYSNTYQVFKVCDDNLNLTVWKRINVLENNLSKGDLIVVNGLLTSAYGKPEINYVSSVIK